jgi:membrane protease YdiL (CAAX protease family)
METLPDPGSRRAARLALVLSGVLFITVAVLQTLGGKQALAPKPDAAYTLPAPNEGSQLLESRMAMGLFDLLGPESKKSIGEPPGAVVESPPTGENVRAAAIVAYFNGLDAALEHLRQIRVAAALDPDRAMLVEHAERFEHALRGEPLTEVDRASMIQDHGWFARLALAFPSPEGSPERDAVLRPAARLVVLLFAGAIVILGAFVTGLVLLIVFAVKISGKRLQRGFERPAPGGSVYLEVFAAFLVGFLVLQLVVGGVVAQIVSDSNVVWWIGMGAQWLLLGVIAYPMLRRVPPHRVARDLGLNRGKGVLREIGAGVVGYLAGLPLIVAGFGLVLLIQWFIRRGGGEAPTPHNPILDATGSGTAVMVMIVALATVWAPIVEETVFRGALFRHVRSRLPLVPAAIFVGLLFAFMHPYGPAFTPPLIMLGTVFALLREWRGSLIAPMIAHALHNGSIMALMILVTSAGGA